jgi:hypothetical protein
MGVDGPLVHALGPAEVQEDWPDGYYYEEELATEWCGEQMKWQENTACVTHVPVLVPVGCLHPGPPPMPEGDNVYKPSWVYGSSWPFNCAPITLILENLPMELTQCDLIQILDEEGFHSLYDFLFLPASTRTGKSSCRAVINFPRHSHALLLAAHYHGRVSWGAAESWQKSGCRVKWSFPLQGLPELLERYRNDVTMHESIPDHLQPALFSNGWRIPMPAPTRHIRPPQDDNNAYRTGKVPHRWVSERWEAEEQKQQKGRTEELLQIESVSEFPALGCSSLKKKNLP